QAGPISISQVVQVVGSNNRIPDLRLRTVAETNSVVSNAVSSKVSTSSSSDQPSSVDVLDTSSAPVTNSPESLLSGIAINTDDNQTVDVISQGDLEGSICDCG